MQKISHEPSQFHTRVYSTKSSLSIKSVVFDGAWKELFCPFFFGIWKEFFRVSLDELEQIVNDIDPTAEFNRTMAAEEYNQSISSDELYTSNYHDVEYDE